ncbi:protoheme IX farnesyltransferase [Geomonas oryzisoli]|uniref:Protoheme IX farnesyltransferase n=1 Tax=Geomonas oryzisoli TaxID=2847992 RepID=A0ABX8J9L0_9BACT|nr:protoheme IX farnesyltransferase [Geomonas oryzisoli]QWV93387.1 protoheme IX farnesyltransferase [Geomonas oryzisoli]
MIAAAIWNGCKGIYRLFRLPLSLMNATAALGGYLMCRGRSDLGALSLFAGVALMACAASALNQVLERDLDALMDRTRLRPIASGELGVAGGLFIGLIPLGLGVLFLNLSGLLPLCLALFTLLWYLLCYTPLKRRTPLALLVGAVCGAATPLIGWSAAGGAVTDFRIVLLCGILYLWQVPHFWMLQKRHAEEYRRAGVPLFAPCTFRGPAPFLVLWLLATIVATLMLPVFGLIAGQHAPLWCLAFCLPLLLYPFERWEPAAFAGVNIFPALLTLALYGTP